MNQKFEDLIKEKLTFHDVRLTEYLATEANTQPQVIFHIFV